MVKSIKVNDNTELLLSNNIAWAMEYRDQFGHDIVPDILPVVSAVASFIGEANLKNFDIKKIDRDVLQDALVNLAGVQFVDFLNLVWAMNKTADPKTPLPRKWADQFDGGFYLDTVAPEVFNLLMAGLVSSKNPLGLRTMTEAPSK